MQISIPVYVSRYTKGLENGKNVHFNKGETVRYRMRNGEEHDITIESEYGYHESGHFGYVATFHDDGQKYFAVAEGIIDWEGKM